MLPILYLMLCNALYYGIYIYTVLCNVWNREGLYCVALLYFIDNIYIYIYTYIIYNINKYDNINKFCYN